ncbi:MAG: hypothetical protein QM669_01095 [Siphonobacter sp.]
MNEPFSLLNTLKIAIKRILLFLCYVLINLVFALLYLQFGLIKSVERLDIPQHLTDAIFRSN